LFGAEIYVSDRGGVLAFPTNDRQVCIAAGRPRTEFAAYRKNIEDTFYWILDASPKFAAKVRAGKREERWMGTADVPNFFRKPWGSGWALVGDAGYMKDPTTGLGIADAFRDASLLARALDDVLSRRPPAEEALAAYQQQRDAAAIPMYDLTLQMASGELPLPSSTE
jgi:2-polyprenyl-6-methoxyphenol hydroxylase-like FAD-dependent oxidoreductase